MSRFGEIAHIIRCKGREGKEWRHTFGGMQRSCVERLYIAQRAARIHNNTWAYFLDDAKQDTIAIQYHNTAIILLHKDGRIEMNSSYVSISTNRRYKEYGLHMSGSAHGVVYVAMPGRNDKLTLPVGAGIFSRMPDTLTGSDAMKLSALNDGARTGDVAACEAMATILRRYGLDGMARVLHESRGERWGYRRGPAMERWRETLQSYGPQWLVNHDTGEMVRPLTKRDVAAFGVDAYAPQCTIDGQTYDIVNGYEYINPSNVAKPETHYRCANRKTLACVLQARSKLKRRTFHFIDIAAKRPDDSAVGEYHPPQKTICEHTAS